MTNTRRIELFASIEREAKQAQSSLAKLEADPQYFAPQQEHVDHAERSIASCLKVIGLLK